jgi:hypothetical protein
MLLRRKDRVTFNEYVELMTAADVIRFALMARFPCREL